MAEDRLIEDEKPEHLSVMGSAVQSVKESWTKHPGETVTKVGIGAALGVSADLALHAIGLDGIAAIVGTAVAAVGAHGTAHFIDKAQEGIKAAHDYNFYNDLAYLQKHKETPRRHLRAHPIGNVDAANENAINLQVASEAPIRANGSIRMSHVARLNEENRQRLLSPIGTGPSV